MHLFIRWLGVMLSYMTTIVKFVANWAFASMIHAFFPHAFLQPLE
jgi:hypothetical protein